MKGNVLSFGLEALGKIRTNREVLADIEVGTLFGLDANGKVIPADRSTNVKAIGIVTNGNITPLGNAREFNKDGVVYAGKRVDAEQFAIVDVDDATFTNAQIGDLVYLSTAGEYETTPTAVVGETLQIVGKIYSKSSILIDLTVDPQGTIVA